MAFPSLPAMLDEDLEESSFYEENEPSFRLEVDEPELDPMEVLSRKVPHAKMLDYITKRLDHSEQEMARFYDRWQSNELKQQAYIHTTDYEQILRDENKGMASPHAAKMIIPFAYATQATIVTYLMNTFMGRRPIFTVSQYKGEAAAASRNMETLLQFQCDYMLYTNTFWKLCNDFCTYGVGACTVMWDEVRRMRTRRQRQGAGLGETFGTPVSSRYETTVYEGNRAEAVDPFMFFPDPRVTMADCPLKGEYMFWRTTASRLHLKRNKDYQNVDKIDKHYPADRYAESFRNRLARGRPEGSELSHYRSTSDRALEYDFVWIDQGTIWIVPSEHGLGDRDEPELWFFTVANKDRIIEARPLGADHDQHPVAVSEPFGQGYGFGQAGVADFIAPIQDMVTWFFTSHQENVRSSLNMNFIVDPNAIMMKDLRKRAPGSPIRLKQSFIGRDVKTAIMQLPVQDVTRSHINDAQLMMTIGQLALGVSDNLMGQQDSGGRKTATESRIASQAGIARLQTTARVISGQLAVPTATMMALNTVQYMSDGFYQNTLGEDGTEHSIFATDLDGLYTFAVHDGSLPFDKVALFEVWKDILLGALQAPGFAEAYDVRGMFEWVAELGGATDIERFRNDQQQGPPIGQPAQASVAPDEAVARGVEQGNLIPMPRG
jgi:hypothetical protein